MLLYFNIVISYVDNDNIWELSFTCILMCMMAMVCMT